LTIEYSDGIEFEERVLGLLREAKDVSSGSIIGADSHSSWPIRYHLSPERANLVRHLDFSGLDLLEIGGGTGAVSRFLSEEARSLHVIEGTQRRFDCVCERLRDLDNWSGQAANIQDVSPVAEYDVVLLLGVLEYAQVYLDPPSGNPEDAFAFMLDCASRFLKPDGVIIVAIENKLGIKYWSGAAEDHTGRMFNGITGYAPESGPRTFSRSELVELLSAANLPQVDEYYPFPDYKIVDSVLSRAFVQRQPAVSASMVGNTVFENYDQPRALLFPESLALESVANAGLFGEFSNSFLFVASASHDSPTRQSLQKRLLVGKEQAWHYSMRRKVAVSTTFGQDDFTVKRSMGLALEGAARKGTSTRFDLASNVAIWKGEQREALRVEPPLRARLARLAYHAKWPLFIAELGSFFEFSFEGFALENSKGLEISGDAIDAVISNAVVTDEGYAFFDQEWMLERPMNKTLFIFRNVGTFAQDRRLFGNGSPFSSIRGLYESLCQDQGLVPDFDSDFSWECEFQRVVTGFTDNEEGIRKLLQQQFPLSEFPINPALEAGVHAQLASARPPRLALIVKKAIRRVRRMSGLASSQG
jgi:SAM-dependent methyltransferase